MTTLPLTYGETEHEAPFYPGHVVRIRERKAPDYRDGRHRRWFSVSIDGGKFVSVVKVWSKKFNFTICGDHGRNPDCMCVKIIDRLLELEK